jgi:hypothetical protein
MIENQRKHLVTIGKQVSSVTLKSQNRYPIAGIHKNGLKRDCKTNSICILCTDQKSSLIKNEQKKAKVTLDDGDMLVRINRETFEITASLYEKQGGKFYQSQLKINEVLQQAILNLLMDLNIEIPEHAYDLAAA